MISEAEVSAVLPRHGLLYNFVWYCQTVSHAPLAYAMWNGLALLSVLGPPDVDVWIGSRTATSWWSFTVGKSGVAAKTSSADLAFELLQEVDPERVGADHESAASFFEAFMTQPQQLIYHGEGGKWLADTKRGYKAPLREQYVSFWDAGPKTKAQKGKPPLQIDRSHFTLMLCVAPEFLASHGGELLWSGGFMGRTQICLARRERFMVLPPRWPEMYQYLVQGFRSYQRRPIGELVGLTEDAAAIYVAWATDLDARRDEFEGPITSVFSRVPSTALKAAMLISLDIGNGSRSNGNPWQLDADSLKFGLRIADMHFRSAQELIEYMDMNAYARDRRAVLDAFGDGGKARTLGAILRRVKLEKRRVEQVLDGLVTEETLYKTLTASNQTAWTTDAPPATSWSDYGMKETVPLTDAEKIEELEAQSTPTPTPTPELAYPVDDDGTLYL